MRLSTLTITTALGAALFSTSAFAETIRLYTWRPQEVALWNTISEQDLLGDIDIEVVEVQSDNYDTKLRADLQSGGPDIFQGRAGAAWLSAFIDAGIIKPLPETVDLANIAPAALDAGRGPDGELYGVPFAIQMQSFIYNTAVFEQNGISVPTSMDELNTAMATLSAAGITPISFGARSGWWLNQVVGETMTAGMMSDEFAGKLISGAACFTDPEFVSALETIKAWQDAGYINASAMDDDYGAMRTSVALGEAAMMLDGAWSTGPASPMYEIDPELHLGFFPVPGANGKVYAFGDGTYLINANSPHQEAALKVLQFTTTQQFAELFVEQVGELPAFASEYEVADPLLAQVAELVANNASSQTPFFAYALNSGQPSYGQLMETGLQALLSGSTTPTELAQTIQAGLNSWNYAGAANCQ
jgi:raffinose/stachyose/melibiose transport system substrate-binding protein